MSQTEGRSETVTLPKEWVAALLHPPFASYCDWRRSGEAAAANVLDEWDCRAERVRDALDRASGPMETPQ